MVGMSMWTTVEQIEDHLSFYSNSQLSKMEGKINLQGPFNCTLFLALLLPRIFWFPWLPFANDFKTSRWTLPFEDPISWVISSFPLFQLRAVWVLSPQGSEPVFRSAGPLCFPCAVRCVRPPSQPPRPADPQQPWLSPFCTLPSHCSYMKPTLTSSRHCPDCFYWFTCLYLSSWFKPYSFSLRMASCMSSVIPP